MATNGAVDEDTGGMIVGSFAKNTREAICVGVSEWKGRTLIFVRTFAQALEGDVLVPTREGVSLAASLYPDLLAGVRALGEVMGSDKVVARICKNERQEVRVGFNTYKGNPLIYIRTFSLFKGSEEWSPTRQGVTMRVDLYPHLLEAVEKLGEALSESQGGGDSS